MIRAALLALALLAPSWAHAHAQAREIPRTPEGRPDFTGAWLSPWITTLERMPGATTLDVDAAEARKLGEGYFESLAGRGAGVDPEIFAGNVQSLVPVDGRYRTSIVYDPADGRIPYAPAGRAMVDAARGRIFQLPDGPEGRPDSERCIAGHGRPPMSLTPSVNPRQITQTSDNLVIYTEDGPDMRIISFGDASGRPALRPQAGDSGARWDGDELVIDTTNLQPTIRGGVQGTFATSADTLVTERLKLLAPDRILYSYEVTDAALYTRPWRGAYVLLRTGIPAMEYSCHEGNYAMSNMLESARSLERRGTGKP